MVMQLGNSENSRLEGLIESYELAFKMQTSVPSTINIDKRITTNIRKIWYK